jgi:hypothetical protein
MRTSGDSIHAPYFLIAEIDGTRSVAPNIDGKQSYAAETKALMKLRCSKAIFVGME